MALALPKINGATGIILRGLFSMVTGPAKIDGLKQDIAHIKTEMDGLQGEVKAIRVDVAEIKGELHGYIQGHKDRIG